MTITLVVPEQIADELFEAAKADVETAGVLLARHVETPCGDVRLLARGMHWVPDAAYPVREAKKLSIASHGYVPALAAQRPISLSRSGCIRILGTTRRPDRARMTRSSTRNLPTSSGSVREARYTGQSSSPEPGGVSVSPATSSLPTDAPTSTAYGLPAAGSRSFRTGSTRHHRRRTSSTGTFAPSVGKSKRFSAT